MKCEECKRNLIYKIEGSTQGWGCPVCGGNVVTTYIDEIIADNTEYSLYMKDVQEIDTEKIRFVAKTAGVNFVAAKQMLLKREVCILKAKAPEVKSAIEKLEELKIKYEVSPKFKY